MSVAYYFQRLIGTKYKNTKTSFFTMDEAKAYANDYKTWTARAGLEPAMKDALEALLKENPRPEDPFPFVSAFLR